jgi:outer membrane protein TolC
VLRRATNKLKPNNETGRVRKIARLLKLLSLIIAGAVCVGQAHAQEPRPAPQIPAKTTTQSPAAQSPRPGSSPQTTTPSPNVTTSPAPSAPAAAPQVAAQSSGQAASGQLMLDDVLRLANAQVSGLRQAQLNERVAEEDVRQARAAFLPKVTAPLDYIYTSPALGLQAGEPRAPSYIANNAIGEYQALVSVAGDVDLSGRLRAALARNRALLEAARAGTEVARSALRQATVEAYYGLALTAAQTRSAEQNLAAAQEFERITSLLLSGGEVAPVDLTRAQLQTNQRQGELEQARANESVAADALRVLVGYDQARTITVADLATLVPAPGEVERLTAGMIQRRPELLQFEAQIRAAEQDVRVARADRLPQLSYTINGGFDTDSLRPPRLREHTGFSAAFNLTIPIFDWGATRSRERQAQVKLQVAENERTQALRGFAQQFNSARTQALSAAARIRLAGTAITLAQSNLEASTARYRAGEAQIIEVTDAQTTLAAQRLAFFQALFDYQVALARLRQAAGQ